jgi:hypothetical protein
MAAGLVWAGGPSPKALVVDYQLNPPPVLARLLQDLRDGGFDPLYRPFYPQITRRDLRDASLVVLLSGDGPGYPGTGMSAAALGPLEAFVRRGGALVLGPLPGSGEDGGGDHERHLFNLLLNRLGIPIQIEDNWVYDDENRYAAPLYDAPFAVPSRGHPMTRDLPARMVTDRSPALRVGPGVEVLAHSFASAFPQGDCSRRGVMPLMAVGRAGDGVAVVAGRYMLTWGGGNTKEPGAPLRPLPEEEGALRDLLRRLMAFLAAGPRDLPRTSPQEPLPVPPPGFPVRDEAVPEAPPKGTDAVKEWAPAPPSPRTQWDAPYAWIAREGIRSGWAHIDKEPEELQRLAQGLQASAMNALWGVAFPQLLLRHRGNREARARLLTAWEAVGKGLKGSPVRWFMGMEYPGRYAAMEAMPRAMGAEGRGWDIPSPWDHETWRREVIRSATLAAQWARGYRAVAGIVLDLEMYGRRPLFFSQGVDFGDGPFRAFLEDRSEEESEEGEGLRPEARFPWLRDKGLLADYYAFLERRAEALGRELRLAVREVHPDLIVGCYAAGILHRWFYRGLWRGLSEPDRPVILFTFQRDADLDLTALHEAGVHAIHVRGLLMGQMEPEEYRPLFADALARHGGYWLNRLTSLVARQGFYPNEAPRGMSQEDAWKTIAHANRAARRPYGVAWP